MASPFKSLFIICACILGVFLLLSALVIMSVREKNSRLGINDKDFIQSASEKLQKRLSVIPGAMSVKRYLTLLFLSPIFAGLAVWIFSQSALGTAAAVIVGCLVPEIMVRVSSDKGRVRFELSYSKALAHMAASLRAGLSIRQAVSEAADCSFLSEEVRIQFRQMTADMEIGISIPEAFSRMADRVNNEYTQDTASAIALQYKLGGSEAELVEKIALTISKRISLRSEIKTAFAEVATTVRAMNILPYLVLGLMFLSSGMYAELYFSDPGYLLIFLAMTGLMVIGNLVTGYMLKQIGGK